MLRMNLFRAAVLSLMLVPALFSHAQDAAEPTTVDEIPLDEVLLKNGSRILGTVISARDGTIVIETDFAGTLTIDSETVDQMRTQGSLVVQLADGHIVRDQPIVIEPEGMLVSMDSGEQRA